MFSPWVGKISWRKKWVPTLVFFPGEFRGTEEPGKLHSTGLQRIGHDWATSTKQWFENLLLRNIYFKTPTLRLVSQCYCSVAAVSNSLWPHGLQCIRLPCPSLFSGVYPNSCPLNQWCHPTILFSIVPFSSCLQSFLASGSFPVSLLFRSGGIGSISASASVLPMNIQSWFPLGWTDLISWQFKGLSRVFSSATAHSHQFFGSQPFLLPTSLLEKP